MSAYLPQDCPDIWFIVSAWSMILLAGLLITRLHSMIAARWTAWALVVFGTAGLDWLCAKQPAGLRMLTLIVGLLYAMKAVVSVEVQATGGPCLSPLRWLGFATLWVGMRPSLFAAAGGASLPGVGRLLRLGLQRLAEGLALVCLARALWVYRPTGLSDEEAAYLVTILFLPGLSLMLHFGILNLQAGLWRLAGVDCRPLFRAPLRARSLTEFWGRRWNLAFSEMTTLAVYRPLARWLGTGAATALAFLFSGLLHELAISVPVRAGYGLPLLYFGLHGFFVQIERRWEKRNRPVESWGWPAHLWTLGWLALPLPILFHPYFLRGVVWPLLGIEIHG